MVHTDILAPIDPIAEDGHRYAVCSAYSFFRELNTYFRKTRDEDTEKFEMFIADLGVLQF